MLLIGGRYDVEYPPDSQEAFIKYLGTADEDVRHIIYDTGHNHPGSEALNESLAFLDKYFGKVELKEH